ncbi:MAG: alkaline phosphatase family protein [Acidobacteriota bacterium]
MAPPPINHLIVLMMENRSFDHMLGYVDPDDDQIEDLSDTEVNFDPQGNVVQVGQGASFNGPADPGHHFLDVNEQLFETPDPRPGDVPTMGGFVINYAKQPNVKPKRAGDVMKCFAPEDLPVLATLAREFALCDAWFSSVPGPTLPNRAFAHCASSNGSVDMNPLAFVRLLTIYERLFEHGVSSKVYAHDGNSLATSFPALLLAGDRHLGSFEDFKRHLKNGTLPSYSFIEPRYNDYFDAARQKAFFSTDQHPPHDVRHGENLIADVYEAVRKSDLWEESLLVVTYDEHGGFFDHVPPPAGVPPLKNSAPRPDAMTGFDFTRLGVRVPAVLISPFIEPATVVKTQFDHTSLIATARKLFAPGALPLTERDAVAHTFEDVLTRSTPRDARKKLNRDKLEAPARPAQVGRGPLSEHQTSQVISAHRLDQLLPAEKRVIGSSPEFMTLQDIWTEQRAIDYVRLVSKRSREQWARS